MTTPQIQHTQGVEEIQTKKDINEDFFDCIPEGLVILDEHLKVVKHNTKILQYLQITDPKNIPASLDTLLRLAQKNRIPQKDKKKPMPLKSLKQNSDLSIKYHGSMANQLKKQFWVSDKINFTKGDSVQYPFLQPILNDFKLTNENMTINSEGSIVKYQLIQETYQKQRHLQVKIYEIQMTSHSKNLVFLFIVENITNKEQLRLLRTRFKIQQSLLNSFSHELRTPLNCTLSLLQALKSKLKNEEITKMFLNPAIASSQRLLYQINDILDYAQIECQDFKINITEFKVGDIFQNLKDFFGQECSQKQIELIIDYDNLITIKNDKDRITQVLINLVNNSLKFTPQGGRIIINIKKRDNLYQFTVWDNGRGISNLTMANIFENNFNNEQKVLESQVSSNKLGLGLRVSRAIVKYLSENGELIIKSQQGSYTSVNFFVNDQIIKINENVTEQESDMRVQSKQIVKKCECPQVLIVDDVPFNHIAMIAMLNNFGIKSDSAYDGMQAIEKVNQRIQNYECCKSYRLIFMDIEMPGMNGFQTSTEIVKILSNSNTKSVIIMCSAYSGEENIEQAKQCGMKEVISKPIYLKNLQTIITKYFQSISLQQ